MLKFNLIHTHLLEEANSRNTIVLVTHIYPKFGDSLATKYTENVLYPVVSFPLMFNNKDFCFYSLKSLSVHFVKKTEMVYFYYI